MTGRMQGSFSAEEERELRGQLAQGDQPSCPRCDGALDLMPARPRSDVAYVRNRVLIQCPRCKVKGVVDR
jgi:hypothetical protein